VTLAPGVSLFVNLHGLELNDEALYDPTSILARHAPRVVLEITERTALDAVGDASVRVAMLRRLG
jgi:EAL domain-containing protein (putative c-di-GMP-specific phosphodiesterase class I)